MEAPIGEWTGLEVSQALSEASGVAAIGKLCGEVWRNMDAEAKAIRH